MTIYSVLISVLVGLAFFISICVRYQKYHTVNLKNFTPEYERLYYYSSMVLLGIMILTLGSAAFTVWYYRLFGSSPVTLIEMYALSFYYGGITYALTSLVTSVLLTTETRERQNAQISVPHSLIPGSFPEHGKYRSELSWKVEVYGWYLLWNVRDFMCVFITPIAVSIIIEVTLR